MSLPVDRIREETPGCRHVLHLNNAGAALMPSPVIEAVNSYFELECMYGGYEAARERHAQIEAVYDSIATLINCTREQVAVVENATVGWDMAFYSLQFAPGDRILTCRSEYASNYIAYLQVCRRSGARVEAIANDEHGQVSLDALESMIDPSVKLIAITHIPTNGGLVNPAREIGEIARRHGITYLLDACQSAGQVPIDVHEIGCHLMSTTSRKYLRGPRGAGFLYVYPEMLDRLEPPFLDLHSATWVSADSYEVRADARRFENWESNYSAKVGLGAAVDYALQWGLEPIWERVRALGQTLRANLSSISGVQLLDLGDTKCGIVTFAVRGRDAESVQAALSDLAINVSVTNPQDTLLDSRSRGLGRFVRASVHYYNSDAELDTLCNAVENIARH